MTLEELEQEWAVTPEKIAEVVRRIVAKSDPLQVILFGSRARGDFRADSDVDIAVILDAPEEEVHSILPYQTILDVNMEITLVPVSKEKFDQHRPWINSIFNYIDREGIVLYDREHPEHASTIPLHSGSGGRVGAVIPTA